MGHRGRDVEFNKRKTDGMYTGIVLAYGKRDVGKCAN
jgi:hypothetical protein